MPGILGSAKARIGNAPLGMVQGRLLTQRVQVSVYQTHNPESTKRETLLRAHGTQSVAISLARSRL